MSFTWLVVPIVGAFGAGFLTAWLIARMELLNAKDDAAWWRCRAEAMHRAITRQRGEQ